jgi:hypothetical protein
VTLFSSPDYKSQPVYDFLRSSNKPLVIDTSNFKTEALGAGWSWDDYNDDYMVREVRCPSMAIHQMDPGERYPKSNPISGNEDNAHYSDPK